MIKAKLMQTIRNIKELSGLDACQPIKQKQNTKPKHNCQALVCFSGSIMDCLHCSELRSLVHKYKLAYCQ